MEEKKLFQEIPSKAEFHSAVLTSFSFDFYHFESQVLRALKAKGVTNVNLLVDSSMLDQSIGFATGHLKSLSTSYSVAGIHAKGVFHPKISLLAGDQDVLLLFGSGNLTNGGHGKNHEAFNVYYATEEHRDQLSLILEAWQYVKSITRNVNGVSREKLSWVEDNCSLLRQTAETKHKFHSISDQYQAALLYNDQTSIWEQVKGLMPDEIDSIKVFSPFYDENGSFLINLKEQFSSSNIDVYLQEGKGIHPFKLPESNSFNFHAWDSTQRGQEREAKLHAKLLWFRSGDQEYLIVGSANATIPAFGTDNARGVNDEFSVLINTSGSNLIKTLGLTGKVSSIKPRDNRAEDAVEAAAKGDMEVKHKIKLYSVDLNGKRLSLFYKSLSESVNVKVAVCNAWGEGLESKETTLSNNKQLIDLSYPNLKELAFLKLLSDEGNEISNKQTINNIQSLWNTNPSRENRRLLKLSSLIETGSNGVFDILDFYNTIQSGTQHHSTSEGTKKRRSEGAEEDEEPDHVPYDEAIARENERRVTESRLTQSHAVRLIDTIERRYKLLAESQEEGEMNDEETGDTGSSNDRDEDDGQRRVVSEDLHSLRVLARRRKNIDKFFSNYKVIVDDFIASERSLDMTELAMYLISVRQAIHFASTPLRIKVVAEDEEFDNQPLLHLKSRNRVNDSYSNVIISTIGHLVNALCAARIETHEEVYYQQKLTHYKNLTLQDSLMSLAIVMGISTYDDQVRVRVKTLAYNIIEKLGDLDDQITKSTYKNQVNDFLKLKEVYTHHCKSDTLSQLSVDKLLTIIRDWYSEYLSIEEDPFFFRNNELGICHIKKFIPKAENPRFLRLARPGFEYTEQEEDFVLSELYNCETGGLQKSLQTLKKQQIST